MSARPHHDVILSPLLPRLVDAIGMEATVKLLQARGGALLELPKSAERSALLVDLIGQEAAARLIAAFPGYDRISLPMPDKLLTRTRNVEILADLERGDSERIVARRYSLTVRQVQNVRREARQAESAPSAQESLF